MTTKEKIKKNLDDLPSEVVDQVYEFIKSITAKGSQTRHVRTFRMSGRFDNEHIRRRAYE